MKLLILLTVLIPYIQGYILPKEENVIVTDKAPYWEGRNHTLSCKLKELRSAVQWITFENNNTRALIAYCSEDFCTLNPAYDGQYYFSYDLLQCIFNLTIINVTKHENGRKLVCSDGKYSDCEILDIEDTEPAVNEDTEKGIITVTSACFPEHTSVSFKFIKIKAFSKEELQLKPKILNKTDSPCSNECENPQPIRHILTLSAEPNSLRTSKYKVEVVYGSERIVSIISTTQNLIEEKDLEESVDETPTVSSLGVGLIVLAIVVVIFIISILTFKGLQHKISCYHMKAQSSNKETDEGIPFLIDADHAIYKRVLNRCHKRFVEELDTTLLLDMLFKEGTLSFSQLSDIQGLESSSNRTREILKIVSSKKELYEIIKLSLKGSKQKHLAEYLEQQESDIKNDLMNKEHKWESDKKLVDEMQDKVKSEKGKELMDKDEKEDESKTVKENKCMDEDDKEDKVKSKKGRELMGKDEKQDKLKTEKENEIMDEEKKDKVKSKKGKELIDKDEKENISKTEKENEFMDEKEKLDKLKTEKENEFKNEKKEHNLNHDQTASRQTWTGKETVDENIVDTNFTEKTNDKDLGVSYIDEEATTAGKNSRDYQLDLLQSRGQNSGKETCTHVTTINGSNVLSCPMQAHDENTESLPVPDLQYFTTRNTSQQTKDVVPALY